MLIADMLMKFRRQDMATKSFYEDLVIDTPEAAENFTRFVEEGTVFHTDKEEVPLADEEFVRRLAEKHGYKVL